jgi:hypothetical protein
MHDPEPFQSALMSEGSTDESTYVRTDLVSNISRLAEVTDLNLINPWGVSFSPGDSASSGRPVLCEVACWRFRIRNIVALGRRQCAS